nr:MAG TPA: hypothetical protein [Caudoviricetes sp.]
MRANVFCVIPDIVLCFYIVKVTINFLPHTDMSLSEKRKVKSEKSMCPLNCWIFHFSLFVFHLSIGFFTFHSSFFT